VKICPVGAKMFHAERWKGSQADMMKLTVTFTILQMCLKNYYKSLKTSHCDTKMQTTSVFNNNSSCIRRKVASISEQETKPLIPKTSNQ